MRVILLKDERRTYEDLIRSIKADEACIRILDDKTSLPVFLLKDIRIEAANIIKQTALSVGCDAAVSRGVISGEDKISDALLMCSLSQLKKIRAKLHNQPFRLSESFDEMMDILQYKRVFKVRGIDMFEKRRWLLMGILNVTPDSFYDGGSVVSEDDAVKRCAGMLDEGADIIDIGGESTRPNSDPVGAEEELRRVLPAVKRIKKEFPNAAVSVDTYRSETAAAVLDAGADIINDISGMTFDPMMAETVARRRASAILMHIKGNPKNMQNNPEYGNILAEITDFLGTSVQNAEKAGIECGSIAVDPGIGFGKTFAHNNYLIDRFEFMKSLKKPIMIGVSNKGFLSGPDKLPKEQRVEATIAVNAAAFIRGAAIFRVHNVKENFRALKALTELEDASV